MAKALDKLINTIVDMVDKRISQRPKAYDTQAEVVRIDNDTAYVHIPNGVDETPVRLTIAAEVGDTVQVRVSNGRAWIMGNGTHPPTDDHTANEALQTARKAAQKAEEVAGDEIMLDQIMYLVTDQSSGVTVDTEGWSDTPQIMTESAPYLWTYHIQTTYNGTTKITPPVLTGTRGSDGTSVTILGSYDTVEELEAAHPTGNTGDAYLIQGDLYVWNGSAWENVGTIQGPEGPQGPQGPQGQTGSTGATGNGISRITEYYARGTSSTTAPTTWSTTVPTMTATYPYLWNYEVVTYTSGSTHQTAKRVIGRYGQNGRGISTITEYYLATSAASGVTTSTSGWTTTVQTITATNKYLWNYEVITYTDSTTKTIEPHIIGVYGNTGPQGPQGDPGKTYVQLVNGQDLNNCITKDYVYVSSSTAICESLVNAPSEKPNGEINVEVVWLGSDNYLLQRASCKNGAQRKIYIRTYSSGTFGAWTEEGVPVAACTTAAATAAKTATFTNRTISTGDYFAIQFTYANTAVSPTLNINGSGAKAIMTNGSNSAYWAAGATVNFYYDGTYYQVASTPVYASEVTVGNPNSYNAYIGNAAFQIRNGSSVYTQVDANGMLVQNGASNKKFLQSGTDGLHVYNGSVTEVAVLGYASGTAASGTASAPYFSLGTRSGTIGNWSGSFGSGTASGYMSFIQGYNNTASNLYTMARGYECTASGTRSFSCGYKCTASGTDSIAMGSNCTATSSDSKALGYYCNSTYSDLFVVGKYNNPTSGDLFEVGDGSSSSRSNAFRVNNSGNAYVRNALYLGGHASQVGDYKESEVSTRATASDGSETSTGCSVSLGIGTWVVGYIVSFVAGNGTRTCALYNGSSYIDYSRTRLAVASTGYTILNNSMMINLTSAATITLYAGHAGVSSSQTYNASLRAVRIA